VEEIVEEWIEGLKSCLSTVNTIFYWGEHFMKKLIVALISCLILFSIISFGQGRRPLAAPKDPRCEEDVLPNQTMKP
jgi:hypothetical protein